MKKLLIPAVLSLLLTYPAVAEDYAVLTPSNLYDMIEREQQKSALQTALLGKYAQRIKELERKTEALRKELDEAKAAKEDRIRNLETHVGDRLDELERKMLGVQKQITVLHAKAQQLKKQGG